MSAAQTQKRPVGCSRQGVVESKQERPSSHPNCNPAELLLSRLEGSRETGPGRWLARCPAHDDGRPSLSIRETSDQTVLAHCFAECATADVLAAVGLELRDLFPDNGPERSPRTRDRRIPATDALTALDHEAHVVAVIASDIRRAQHVEDDVWERLATAARRIGAARGACR